MMTFQRKLTYLSVLFIIILFMAACGQEAAPLENIDNSSSVTEESFSASEPEAEPESDSNTTEEAAIDEEVATPDEPVEEVATDEEPSTPDEPTEEVLVKKHVVEIVEFAFSPSELEVKAGDTVVFVNKDSVRHTATADDDSFNTELLDQDEKKEIIFQETGEFSYYCLPHPAMKGTIVVMEK